MKPLQYTWLKVKAQALLVLGQRGAAMGVFDAMLAQWADDPYALGSKAHLLAQSGDNAGALCLCNA
jgi:hypothetical protein